MTRRDLALKRAWDEALREAEKTRAPLKLFESAA